MYFTVFGKENCPYCVRAKGLLQSKMLEFTYRDVVEDEVSFMTMNQWVYEAKGEFPKTVPQIFVDDRHVGGYEDLVGYLQSEKEAVQASDFDIGDL